jgi:hypothetical protein
MTSSKLVWACFTALDHPTSFVNAIQPHSTNAEDGEA